MNTAEIKWDSPEGVKLDTAPSHDVKWDEPQDVGIGSFLATKAERGIKGVAQSILQFAKDLSLNDSLMRQAPFAKDAKTRGGERLVTASPDTIATAIERLQQTKALTQPGDPQTDSTALRFAGDVVETLPQVGVQIAASLIGGPVLGTGTIGAQIAGAQSRELEQSGISPERRLKAGTANALMQAPLEQIGVGKVLGVSSLAKLGGAMVTEFVTEVVQKYPELATNIWAETEGSTLPERADQFVNGLAQATKDGLYEGAVAATIGGAAGGVNLVSARTPKNIKWDEVTDPSKLAEAVGKPEQIAHLEKMGLKDKDAQAREIVRDAVGQPENLARLAESKDKTELAIQLHQKAVANGEKLIAADGPVTEAAVAEALKPAPPKSNIPADIEFAISKMESDLSVGEVGGVAFNEAGDARRYQSTNPNWFKAETVKAFDKENGTSYASVINKKTVLGAIANKRAGAKLNTTQDRAWDYIEAKAREAMKHDPELALGNDVDAMQAKGYEPVFGEVPAASVAGFIKNGEEFVNKGFDKEGRVILEDGETIRLDPWEKIKVDGIKNVVWDEPTAAVAGASVVKYSESPAIIEIPEIVGMARDLLGGKYPTLVNKFRKAGVQGMFNTKGEIKLRRDLAQDINQASKTLAHEVGHAVDWLPDQEMKRGNILGRIASLKKYAKNHLAPRPVNLEGTTQGPLTEGERTQLRKEARFLANKDAEKLIDEVIKKEIPVSPEEVLAIFKGLKLEKDPNKDLVNFIFTASTPVKKSLILQAMKGLSPKEVAHLKDTIEVKTGNQIKQGLATEKEIRNKARQLIKNEIARRMLFERETITNELKKHTVEWRPFTPMANKKYTVYRHSSPELYADAISALITSPKTLERNAPTFYKAFFNYLERKPEVKRVWEEIQDNLRTGTVSEKRIESDYEMFQRGHEAREAMRAAREKAPERALDTLARGLWDRNHAVLKELRKLENKGGTTKEHARNTRYDIEEIAYISSEADAYMNDFNRRVQRPLEDSGVSIDDVGVYLMRRHIETNREGIFSTKGYTPDTVQRDLAVLEQQWGPEKFATVQRVAEEYRQLRERDIIPLIEEAGLATPELMQAIKSRDNYSRVSVIKYLEEAHGKGTTSRIYKQVGTLEEIENPLVATVLQDLSMMRAARINIAKRSLVQDLTATNAISPADMKYSQDRKGLVPVDPKDDSLAVFTVMVDGKPQHYYTAKAIADAFKYQPFEATQIANVWRYMSLPIRDILVSKNPIWMARNIPRDFLETVKKVPEIKLRHTPKLAREYKQAWKEVWQEVSKQQRSETIQAMMRGKTITPDRVWQAKEMNFEDELQRIADGFNLSAAADSASAGAKGKMVRFYRHLDRLGRASELLGKTAGYNYLKKYSTRSEKEIGHLVRSRIGTPDFKRQGEWQTVTNNLFMFSNVNKEGIRAHAEAYRENPQSYIWKTVAINFLPKAVLAATAAGAFGNYEKKVVDGIPEYDKANYTVIPLYLDDNGKSVYLRIPEDYEGQFFGALAWKLAHLEIMGKKGAVSAVAEHHPYSLNPLLAVGYDIGTYYLRDQNPIDSFRGEQIIPDRAFEAGGLAAGEYMAKHAWRGLGGSVFYEPSRDDLKRNKTNMEKVLKTFPGNIIGTFLRTSDQGISERIDKDLQEYRKGKARVGIRTDKAFVKLANGEQISADELALIMAKGGQAKQKMQDLILKQHGTAYASALARARSKEEILLILNTMENDNGR